MSKFYKKLETHQSEKCRKCPFAWYDGAYSESGCYIEEGRISKSLQKLREKLVSDEYSGCFIPLPYLKFRCWISLKIEKHKFESKMKKARTKPDLD